MRLLAALAFFLSIVATQLNAGPWARPAGERFFSLSRGGGATSIWVESGIDNRQWLVGQIRRDRGGMVVGMLAWRRAIGAAEGPRRLALSLGGEHRSRGGGLWLRPGLLWGYGFQQPLPGWIAMDLSLVVPVSGRARTEIAGHLTLGVRPTEHFLTMLQLQAEHDRSGRRLYLAPSVAWEWREGAHLQLGLRQRAGGDRARSLTLASWVRF